MTITGCAHAGVTVLAAALTLLYAKGVFADGQGQRTEDEQQYMEHKIIVGVGGAAELELAAEGGD